VIRLGIAEPHLHQLNFASIGQLGDVHTCRVGQSEQHHITDGLTACYGGNTDHMAKLFRAKGGGVTGGGLGMVVHGALSV